MCGIAGIVLKDSSSVVDQDLLKRMSNAISHRGPDGSGVDVDGNVGLAHRRLAIIDLSDGGAQPMWSPDRQTAVVFNGEIYNFKEVRKRLEERFEFRSHSDTEVLLRAYEAYGAGLVDVVDGMFSFAILDRKRQVIVMGRDPFGIKPLYYSLDSSMLLFASEPKAILASGCVSRDIDQTALNDYFDYGWVVSPRSIFSKIKCLPPASLAEFSIDRWDLKLSKYWRPSYRPKEGRLVSDWVSEAETALRESVSEQLVADVPRGVFLSGGIDSTLISAAVADVNDPSTLAFTMDMVESGFSELDVAKSSAASLGLRHVVEAATGATANDLRRLSEYFDEPFADSSALPTFKVSQLASKRVKVALSGDGGDELFSGYKHHASAARLEPLFKAVQAMGPLSKILEVISAATSRWSRLSDWSRRFSLSSDIGTLSIMAVPGRSRRLSMLHPSLRESDEARLAPLLQYDQELKHLPPVTRMQMFDLQFYLPHDMLVKVDRASMANGLEVRVPFLTRKMAELAFSIPEEVRFGEGGKFIPRQMVEKRMGSALAGRKKHGFSVPLRKWLLESEVNVLVGQLSEAACVADGVIQRSALASLIDEVRRGTSPLSIDRSDELYGMLMFSAWYDRYAN